MHFGAGCPGPPWPTFPWPGLPRLRRVVDVGRDLVARWGCFKPVWSGCGSGRLLDHLLGRGELGVVLGLGGCLGGELAVRATGALDSGTNRFTRVVPWTCSGEARSGAGAVIGLASTARSSVSREAGSLCRASADDFSACYIDLPSSPLQWRADSMIVLTDFLAGIIGDVPLARVHTDPGTRPTKSRLFTTSWRRLSLSLPQLSPR